MKINGAKVRDLLVKYLIAQVLVAVMMFAYIELGHDKGWMRADVWYTCIHTHHHFPWQ